ncbi:MAG TPA: ATP-binding protein [Streptosporangiaceae bacterium]|nr:ATP-binding protein [Streptosporangiaceae bacterium]
MATVEMSFTPLPVHVRTARLVATAVARRSGVEEALLDEVRLAVGEACSRAVEAHQAQCPAEPVRIELTGSAGRFEVVVTDAAIGAADTDGGTPGWAARPAGGLPGDGQPPRNGTANGDSAHTAAAFPQEGLGLAVIAGLADDVQFTRTQAGLSIRMSWPSGGTAG